MNKNNILYYVIVFLEKYDEKLIDKLTSLDNVGFISIVYKPHYIYSLNTLIKYLEPKKTNYKWKIHSIVRQDVEDGEIIDSILDINYHPSNTNHLIVSKNPELLTNEIIDQASNIIIESKYSSDLFGAISSSSPYDIFITTMSIYHANDKNRNQDILTKIKEIDRKIYGI